MVKNYANILASTFILFEILINTQAWGLKQNIILRLHSKKGFKVTHHALF